MSTKGSREGSIGVTLAAIVAVVAVGLHLLSGYGHRHVFDPAELQAIARQGVELGAENSTAVIEAVTRLVAEKYGDHVMQNSGWIFNNAGGAMGSMTILHASLSEYLIIFGTALGTEGHTGRFLADDYFTILVGEQWAALPHSIDREVYRPGDQHHLQLGAAKQYKCPKECWALEYARGSIVSMLPFGFADGVTSSLDFISMYHTVRVTLKGMLRELVKGKV
mmetsp:Transcript_10240/g.31286  ORF Transcript_10240/g.31286 Transcript_10240/m.31286 type:complete len:222 (+) Transcript_10240:60-725(+)|eukprot:CAMPEP_0198734018 /NCGR_PEP_ID=MMETSP1475-20131203/49991_1 /TAXON_ID= ORGANISM="Unidentified sp., Strain CCMP1999" /NCGR_SAMPLE_ID=MMETSP1475 /ASSEMBLY_ACC=CAM_ASM_001111 /LENGTH=221 /DNA_ID=CAMNT_0044497419 /DNA_START=35 /DNA_END=700 /DNA_ORIENTATION=-